MLGGVTRHMLPHLSGVTHLLVKRPKGKGIGHISFFFTNQLAEEEFQGVNSKAVDNFSSSYLKPYIPNNNRVN